MVAFVGRYAGSRGGITLSETEDNRPLCKQWFDFYFGLMGKFFDAPQCGTMQPIVAFLGCLITGATIVPALILGALLAVADAILAVVDCIVGSRQSSGKQQQLLSNQP